jgi:flagellum-specific peptidoglycan hydrolase FlgJ
VNVLKNNKRYEKAFAPAIISDPVKFLHAVLDAGYATGSGYKKLVLDVEKMIVSYVKELNLEVIINDKKEC